MKHYRRQRTIRRWGIPLGVLFGAALGGAAIGVVLSPSSAATGKGYAKPISGCRVTDGDTIRCDSERIRLLAIDAPELPGHCRSGRSCVPGDPKASTASLRDAMTGSLTIDRINTDRYGRTVARVAGAKGDLSCWQLARGQAIYKSAWDNGLRIARTCPRSLL